MRDMALYAAGVATILVALIHGYLGEIAVFAYATIEPARTKLLIRLVWQAGTIGWIAFGILLLAAPSMASGSARTWIVAMAVVTLGAAAAGNAWATGGRHFGWMALTAVIATALAGL